MMHFVECVLDLDVVKVFFLSMEIILSLRTSVVFCGLSGFLILLAFLFKNEPDC